MWNLFTTNRVDYKRLYEAAKQDLDRTVYEYNICSAENTELKKHIEALMTDLKQARAERLDARTVVGKVRSTQYLALGQLEKVMQTLKTEYKLHDEQ